MKYKYFFLMILASAFSTEIMAQGKPVKKAATTPVKISQGTPKPATFIPTIAFSAQITQTREVLVGSDGNRVRRFNQVDFNYGNAFDPAAGAFRAPLEGMYCFVVNVTTVNYGCVNDPLSLLVRVMKNNVEYQPFHLLVNYGSGSSTQGFTCFVPMAAGDVVDLYPFSAACLQGGNQPAYERFVFSGYRVRF